MLIYKQVGWFKKPAYQDILITSADGLKGFEEALNRLIRKVTKTKNALRLRALQALRQTKKPELN